METMTALSARVLPRPAAAPTGTDEAAPEDALHELRVRIPEDLHRQLVSLKLLRGRSLAETVTRALDEYFAEREPGLQA